jgi:hypothetical protein
VVTFLAVLGGFAIFILILAINYYPKRPDEIPVGSRSPEDRQKALAELHAKEHKAATSYAWIDQQKGTVQLPISRAMELTIQELNAKK